MTMKEYEKVVRAIKAYGNASIRVGDIWTPENRINANKKYDKVIALLKSMVDAE